MPKAEQKPASITTHIDRQFAGQVRRFDLMAERNRDDFNVRMNEVSNNIAMAMGGRLSMPPILVESIGGNLSLLAQAAVKGELSHDDVRLVLVAGLACGDTKQLQSSLALYQEESKARPFGEMVSLAVEVVTAAYAGAAAAAEAQDQAA